MRGLLGIFLGASLLLAKTEPVEKVKTQNLIKAFVELYEKSKKNKKLKKSDYDKVHAFFNLEKMANDIIEKHKGKFKEKSKIQDYIKKFSRLIELIAFSQAGEFFQEYVYDVVEVKKVGKFNDVLLNDKTPEDKKNKSEDLDIDITIRWLEGKVVDVLLDGDSLVLDYRNQFGGLISKNGADEFLKALDKKLADTLKTTGAK